MNADEMKLNQQWICKKRCNNGTVSITTYNLSALSYE
jgi:hypothetical protein